ncbi:MAG: hypothetical protein ACJ72J_13150 [Nitrososphaeraceae archaeon]
MYDNICTYFAIHVIKSSTIWLKECDIQAPSRDFYGFVQMIAVKTILIDLVMQTECRIHRYALDFDEDRNSTANYSD